MIRAAVTRDIVGLTLAAVAAERILAVDPRGETATLWAVAAVGCLAAWVAWQDLHDFTIPDGAVAGLALVGLVQRIAGGPALGHGLADVVLLVTFDAVLAGGALLLLREAYFRRRGHDGLGLGDVKLAAAGAVLLGASAFSIILALSALAGIAVFLTGRIGGDPPGKIAFGALLAPAAALAFVAQAAGLLAGPAG